MRLEFCCITNQYVNSYKRLVSAGGSSLHFLGARNRSTLVRIPAYRPNREVACRVELRNPDPAANPYLAFACMLAAGLAGIEEELRSAKIRPRVLTCLNFRVRPAQTGCPYAAREPGRGGRALRGVRAHEKTLGEHIHGYLVETKRAEWNEYQGTVSEWERNRYLEVL